MLAIAPPWSTFRQQGVDRHNFQPSNLFSIATFRAASKKKTPGTKKSPNRPNERPERIGGSEGESAGRPTCLLHHISKP